eukprot:CAMPEP_0116853788 /NCGR_PEP_ID=MMETSP0418-20121206/18152_1 /TAXON_ID=1158023 /ORGANISM="Astrosyne radiata, Strain 13vi08-1A" /LENGTH=268 /DNA_ID=CAMNT_0004486319 /DNA_START=147 /DNA_END=953 /DNA_ORIENTATION=-
MALLLAERGARLILSSRKKESLESVASECRKRNEKVEIKVLVLDLNEKDLLESKAKEAMKAFRDGPIDVLINNGGVSTRVMARDASVDVDQYLTQVDYLSHVELTKQVLGSMATNPHARIVNMASITGKVGVPTRTAYCGAKHAMIGFMDALRIECILNGHDLHIVNVVLGSTTTSVSKNAIVEAKGSKLKTFGETDDNVVNGLDPFFVAERVLSVSHHRSVDEMWLAKSKELMILYLAQYVPQTAMKLMVRSIAKQYAIQKEKSKAE